MPAFALSFISPDQNSLVCVVTAATLEQALPKLKEEAIAYDAQNNDPAPEFTVRDWEDVKYKSQPNYRGCFPLLSIHDNPPGTPTPEFYDDAYHIEEVPHFVV